jgi:RNA-directed DNA polymerase
MTVEHTTGAVSHEPVGGWHSIDWQTAHENVRRLQARIVKATQAGKWNQVKALQRLLTRSYSAKVLAVRRVTENQGKNTPGMDQEIWDTPAKKAKAVVWLKHHGYRPLPLRRVYIDKANGKKRPLGIPTMKDRAMQMLHTLALAPVAETTADANSFGFRSERCTADAIVTCMLVMSKRNSAEWILEGDIESCFDRISHEWLLEHIPMDKVILRKWLKAGYIENSIYYDTDSGTPQGGIISPLLANMALDGLEARLRERFPKGKKPKPEAKVNFMRYADDFIITGRTRELLENEVKPLVVEFLKERGLELSEEKTVITHIETGFDFLGTTLRKYDGDFRTTPAKKNVKRFLKKVRDIIKRNPQLPAGALIALLNPVIRGWAQFHQHVSSGRTFSKVDYAIFKLLWRWAKRRHSQKGSRWVKKKYFKSVDNRQWVFFGVHRDKEQHLFHATSVKVVWHRRVQGAANPYDPAWETYFEQRLGLKMVNSLKGRRQLIALWKEQQGICPVCGEKITKITGWNNHHIKPRILGGSHARENRVLLHPTCHSRIHANNETVEKPRPLPGV